MSLTRSEAKKRESRKRDIGSNPIHDSSSEGLNSIEEKKEALRTDSPDRVTRCENPFRFLQQRIRK